MRLTLPFSAVLLVIASILTFIAYEVWGEGGSFLPNLLLNGVAELTGLAVGVVIAVPIASRFARSRIKHVGSPLARAIAQLRADGSITDQAARRAVMCAVALLDEDHLNDARSAGELPATTSCGVCSLTVETKGGRCAHCGLQGNHWNTVAVQPGKIVRSDTLPR